MLTTLRRILTLAALAPAALSAQTLGVPMLYHPVMRGFGTAFDAATDDSGVTSLAVTAVATIGHLHVDSSSYPLLNVSATATRVGGRAPGTGLGLELALGSVYVVGVSRLRWQGTRRLYVPMTVTIAGLVCGNQRKVIELYLLPVWSFERIEGPSGASWQPSWGTVNAGFVLEYRSGFGFQVAVGDPGHDDGSDPYRRSVLTVGVHWSPHSIVANAGSQLPAGKMKCGVGL